jgi:hypothetical protein
VLFHNVGEARLEHRTPDRVYGHDNAWIDIPGVTDEAGRIRQSRGVTPSPGLYTHGLTWQHTRGSALLGWVGNDAACLAKQSQLSAHEHVQDRAPRPRRCTPKVDALITKRLSGLSEPVIWGVVGGAAVAASPLGFGGCPQRLSTPAD